MRFIRVERCHVCKAIIPKGQKLCKICKEHYPCRDCIREDKTACMCRKWKDWFHIQWNQFHIPKRKQKPQKNNEKTSE